MPGSVTANPWPVAGAVWDDRRMAVTDSDLVHLRRCVELAREALEDGDEPFGSVLVDASGRVRFEDRNRVKDGDQTRHPELAIALWAVGHLTPAERTAATVYTSGEHCPMCSAAHAWVGLGRIVYATSTEQLRDWLGAWGVEPSAVAPLPIQAVAPGVPVDGPAPQLEHEVRELQRRLHGIPVGR
jgi:tRNA(Arg) A34 adenosine deaminase TadA